MPLYEKLVRPLAFLLPPEAAHELALGWVASGMFECRTPQDGRLAVQALGLRLSNPIGLAAGFDKDAVAVDWWDALGFGHVEVGTVTLRPQPGNPRPRLYRLPKDRALINRMGFNNAGAHAMRVRLQASWPRVPIGINLGKNRQTPLTEAPAEYAALYRMLAPWGAYFVVNVSSPNTPGLRSLQDPAALRDILQAIRGVQPRKPLLVKVAPDLEPAQLDALLDLALQEGLDGIVATNTTVSREGLGRNPGIDGGLSGKPLQPLADAALARLARGSEGRLTLIGVGGVFDADDAWRKIALGAHLVQLYTGWVYGGPKTVARILHGLLERMDREGVRSLDELRGAAL
ncbi:MAG: quinone-dependent dihydroorotate dehydrogenase [Fimbriimonadales bacterium]|nr:quinone-dependent dihydroorotate dehydrogenase [Fimbriimonadales bacterium]